LSPRIVTEADLESELALVRAVTTTPAAGIFGPGSMIWQVMREDLVFLGAGRALLLQLAHPWVATAILEHSQTLADPVDRFHRTFNVMFTMVFGTLDQALGAARRLYQRHNRVEGSLPVAAGPFAQGSRYWANEVSVLAWVHATLIDSALATYALGLTPLTAEERERYYGETKLLAKLFGLPEASLPTTWADFDSSMRAASDSDWLAVGSEARRLADALLSGGALWLPAPGWYRAVTARLLPPRVRTAFGLSYGRKEERVAETALAWIRRVYPHLPHALRYVGPYQEAEARLSGRRHPALLTRMLNRAWIGQSRMGPMR
jgi:uncharacterized protein (DUF2236 family)